jgi:tetratricopeptide (TPR) repeat protein
MASLSAPRRATFAVLAMMLLLNCRSTRSYVDKANALFARGEFAEASLNYRKALQKDPTDGDAYYRLGLSELKENKTAAALQDFLQAVRLKPDNKAAKKELSSLALGSYIADADRPKALYDLLVKLSDEWLKQDPHSMEGLRIRGYLAMVERRPDEAADLFLRAHQSNPNDEKITLGLMDALFRNNQGVQAEKVGLDFIAAHNTSGDVYDALYRLYEATKRPADAQSILIRKVKENPKNGAYLLQLASHYARTNKKPEMAEALQRFLANPSGDPNVHLQAGDFYAALGDWPRALEQYTAGAAGNSQGSVLYQDRIARSLIAQNQREEALQILNQAIAKAPGDKEAQALRAALLLGKGTADRVNEGLHAFQSLVEKNPDDSFLKFVHSKAQLEGGDLPGARKELLEIVKKYPHFLDARLSLADIAYRQNNMKEALEHAQIVLQQDPRNLRAQLILGTGLLRRGNLDEAAVVLGRLSRQDPKSIDVHLQLAALDIKKRKFGEAEAAFGKIRESNPDDLRAIAGLVDVDLAQSRLDKAFARLEQELRRTHGAVQIRYLMVMTAIRGGKYNMAIDNLQQIVAATPDSIDPQLQLANVFRLKGDYRHAITTLQKAAFLQPKDPRPTAMLPFLLEKDNRKQEAKLQAQRALKLRPDDPVLMNNLANLLAETGDNLDEALKLARTAVSKAPGEPNFADTLGFVYLKRDDNNQALEVFSNLVRNYPNDPNFAYHLGMTWFQKGDATRAKSELARALKCRPSKEIETAITDLMSRVN